MTQEKEKKHKDKDQKEESAGVSENPVEIASSQEGANLVTELEAARADIETLRSQIEEAETRIAENLDGWQRAQAEFINFKKRIERDREMDFLTMKGDIIRKFLPVLDDLERALANRPAGEQWGEGIELIARKFQGLLEAEGVRRIEAQGQPFDPNFHEAISNEPSDEVESGNVIAVVQNGYMLGERVIRAAVVRVAQ